MEDTKRDYNKIAKILGMALIDDFRGFLIDGVKRVTVPDDKLHIQIALEEMMKIPGWQHESGVGEVPTVELMKEKRAIYITRIPDPKTKGKFQRSIGYINDLYMDDVEYKGQKMKAHEMLRKIAIGMGYDVDEYELLERTENSVKTPVAVTNYKGDIKIKRRKLEIDQPRSVREGDKPQFDGEGNLVGFISGGRFISKDHFSRYRGARRKQENTQQLIKDQKTPTKEIKKEDLKSENEDPDGR